MSEVLDKIAGRLGQPVNKHPEYLFGCVDPKCLDKYGAEAAKTRKKLSLNLESGN